jgi:ectoine hydroxylase-related dioxygenase (phytanoyl-CoA dioxygenase family)
MSPISLRQEYEKNGFVIVPDVFDESSLLELSEMVNKVLDGEIKPDLDSEKSEFQTQWEPAIKDEPDVPRREKIRVVFHMTHSHSFFRNLATSERMLGLVRELLGPDLRYYTDQMFVKPPRHGSAVPWHQDSAYWLAAEPNLMSAWIALDDTTVENGCVRYVPGSHRELLPHHVVESDNPNKLTTRPEFIDASLEVPAEMSAGSICFHHSSCMHHSLPNESGKPRRGLVLIYLPADLEFYKPWDFEYGFKLIS